ncbi:MAG: hypothetical protein M5R40_13230 [Anaerolineae bacterium]|nr:hypothetical protein [Anaerolineae bacterium]
MSESEIGNWKQRTYITGAVAGLVVGVLAAYLFIRAADENGHGTPKVNTMDAIRLSATTIGLLRQIATLGR